MTALTNRERAKTGEPAVNHKRVFRIMRQNSMLLARHAGRRTGRDHDGRSSSCARTCAGVPMASRSHAGTEISSGSPSSSMPMTARSSHGMPSSDRASAAA
ncbi:MAG: hypothetical protein EOS34_32365 [Mesorhizobium sp.]|nr:MAG: hypothetical protein EOS34_32365 [Mesorhizobium sp.]RWI63334.1 MAG: hypothetical protein EOR18_31715 [Mesorhizobium sp.]